MEKFAFVEYGKSCSSSITLNRCGGVIHLYYLCHCTKCFGKIQGVLRSSRGGLAAADSSHIVEVSQCVRGVGGGAAEPIS